MKNPSRLAAAVAVALSGLCAAAPAAQAEDSRPCVSTRESRGTLIEGMKRNVLERRWEVVGLGRSVTIPILGSGWTAYPWCEHMHDGRQFAVFYKHHRREYAIAWVGLPVSSETPAELTPAPPVAEPTTDPTPPPCPKTCPNY